MTNQEQNNLTEEQKQTQSEEKATFYLRTETVDLLDYSVIDLRRMGNRSRLKLNKSAIVDAAINIMCQELKEKGENSILATTLFRQENTDKKEQIGIFYKNVLQKTWSFYKKLDGTAEHGIPIDTNFRFSEVSFDINNKDGSAARYYENRESVLSGNNIIHYKKHHVNLLFRHILANNEPTPDLTGLTKVILNLHNEPNCGHIVLPEKSGLIKYVETTYIEKLRNAVYVAWLNDSQLAEIGLK